jgi:hypothetical protein
VGATYKVGNPIVVRLNDGRIVEAKIRAVIEETNGLHLQVDYGYDENALVHDNGISQSSSASSVPMAGICKRITGAMKLR